MIELYTWPTPNGMKVQIILEECGLPYKVIPIDIGAGDQFEPDFLRISPNNKMPAMVDPEREMPGITAMAWEMPIRSAFLKVTGPPSLGE